MEGYLTLPHLDTSERPNQRYRASAFVAALADVPWTLRCRINADTSKARPSTALLHAYVAGNLR